MQMMMMNGMANDQNETAPTEISGILRVELTDLQSMPKEEVWKVIGKVLDAIRDAGGTVGLSLAEMQMARMERPHAVEHDRQIRAQRSQAAARTVV